MSHRVSLLEQRRVKSSRIAFPYTVICEKSPLFSTNAGDLSKMFAITWIAATTCEKPKKNTEKMNNPKSKRDEMSGSSIWSE